LSYSENSIRLKGPEERRREKEEEEEEENKTVQQTYTNKDLVTYAATPPD